MSAPSQHTAALAADDTTRSAQIRRLLAEKEAESADAATGAGARLAGGRQLNFSGERDEDTARPRRGRDEDAGVPPPARRARAAPEPAAEFAELRPAGAEDMDSAQLVRELEAAMGGSGRLTSAIAEAA
eukprot:3978909-Pleurochrysis_carterae.AAC.1